MCPPGSFNFIFNPIFFRCDLQCELWFITVTCGSLSFSLTCRSSVRLSSRFLFSQVQHQKLVTVPLTCTETVWLKILSVPNTGCWELFHCLFSTQLLLLLPNRERYPKPHKRLKRMLFNETIQGKKQIFKVVILFKLWTLQKQTIKGTTYPLLVLPAAGSSSYLGCVHRLYIPDSRKNRQ